MSECDQFRQYAEGPCFGSLIPKLRKRSVSCLSWRAHGGKRRSSASRWYQARREALPQLDEGKEFGTADRARAHADELAAQLRHNRSSHAKSRASFG